MEFVSGTRVPLNEEQFIDAATARFYDEHARRFMGPVYRRFAAKVAGINLPVKRVLDIGTGSGHLALELAKAHPDWQITGIDISEEMLKLARENAIRNSLADRIELWQSSAESLPFADGFFDLVVSNASLHLWTNPLQVFKEIARVTSPGGYCLIWDNLRLTAFLPFLSLVGWGMGMKIAQRHLWMQAVRSSYTIAETKTILRESVLQDARVVFIPGLLELGIAWRKLV
jgi:ubiquinone/menaquinone biosynthesis C-methylase UbiE